MDLNGNLLNNDIFKNTIRFLATGQINLIQVDVFKSFTKLKGLVLTSRNHKEMFHRNGIEWIKSIKHEINVDLRNEKAFWRKVYKNTDKWNDWFLLFFIRLITQYSYREDSTAIATHFPDEDFCLYQNFPFQQLLTIFVNNGLSSTNQKSYSQTFTCTYMWFVTVLSILL
jgi:hypothetical protein